MFWGMMPVLLGRHPALLRGSIGLLSAVNPPNTTFMNQLSSFEKCLNSIVYHAKLGAREQAIESATNKSRAAE